MPSNINGNNLNTKANSQMQHTSCAGVCQHALDKQFDYGRARLINVVGSNPRQHYIVLSDLGP